jgi:hypothetical protein
VTPDQWERVIHRHGLQSAWLIEHFDELFASTPPKERFLVFWDGDVMISTREKLPPAKKPFPLYARPGAGCRRPGRVAGTSAGSPTRPEHARGASRRLAPLLPTR